MFSFRSWGVADIKESSKQTGKQICRCCCHRRFFILLDELKSFKNQLKRAEFSQHICTTPHVQGGAPDFHSAQNPAFGKDTPTPDSCCLKSTFPRIFGAFCKCQNKGIIQGSISPGQEPPGTFAICRGILAPRPPQTPPQALS